MKLKKLLDKSKCDCRSPRPIQGFERICSDTMERLMRLVVAQGETIQTQLRRMQERDQQIENFEHQLHLFRVQSLGSDYLLQSYLKDPSQDHPQYREIAPFSKEEEKSNDSGVVTEEIHDSECRQLQNERVQHGSYSEELEDVRNHTIILDKLDKVLVNLLDHEESLSRLEDSLAKSTVSEVSKLQEEIASATAVHANTVASARQNEQKLRELDMVLYQRRMTLESLMKEDLKYEQEAIALQTHLDYIIHLPPTAFKLPEETLPKDQDSTNASKSTTPTSAKSILCESSSERIDAKVAAQNSTTAVPNLNVNDHKNLSVSFSVPKNTIKEETSSLKPLIKKESKPIKVESSHIIPVGKVESTQYRDACNAPQNKSSFLVKEIPPPLPATSPPPLDEEDDEDSAKAGSFCVSSRSSTSSDSSRGVMTSCGGATLKPVPKLSPNSSKDIDSTDSNSDTGLSSLHSSSDEGAYVLDTLV